MTDRIYYDDAYITSFTANVLRCVKTEKGYEAVLDRTAFFPEGGGQAADRGTIANAEVLDVQERGGEIIHLLDREVSGECECGVDFETRFDRMQQHTGEHIVCGIVHRIYGYDNVGFHLSDTYVTFDLNGILTRDQLDEIEMIANRAVYENVKVTSYFPDPDSLGKIDYRSKLDLTENVRIVEIEGIDKCACCAPHVRRTGEVGIIKLLDFQNYKGGVRIQLACGRRALTDYQVKYKNLRDISGVLSSGTNNAADFFKKYVDDTFALKAQLSRIRAENITLRARFVQSSERIILFESDLDMNSLRHFANSIADKYTDFCLLFSGTDSSGYVMIGASKSHDMRELARSLKEHLNAKCGGSDKMIQGSVNSSKSEIEDFLRQL